jgi:hypothetical protein
VEVKTIGNRPRGMGTLSLNRKVGENKTLVFRKVKVSLSIYLLESIMAEVKGQVPLLNHPHMVGPRGAVYEDGLLIISYHYYEYSLENMIN